MKKLWLAIGITSFCMGMAGPPAPPGFTRVYSPKYAEQLASVRTASVSVTNGPGPRALDFAVPGFAITNLSVAGGLVSVEWQGGAGPYQAQKLDSLTGTWQEAGGPTMRQSVSVPAGVAGYFRVRQRVALMQGQGHLLTWKLPELTMSDSISYFKLERSNAGVAASATDNGSISTSAADGYKFLDANGNAWDAEQHISPGSLALSNGVYSMTDPAQPSPSLYYRLSAITANGITVPYNVVSLSASVSAATWVKGFGGTNYDGASAVGVDSAGNIYLTVFFKDSIVVNGTTYTANGSNNSGQDYLLIKLQPFGAVVWARQYSGNPLCMKLDTSGNIYVGGSFFGTGNFGGSNFTSNGQQDAFLAKYDTSGNHLWSVAFGGTLSDQVNAITLDSSGNVIITGWFQSLLAPITVAGSPIQSHGSSDTFLAKYTSSGTGLWAKNFPNGSWDQGSGLAVDGSDNIILTGYFQGHIDFGGGVRNNPGGYIAKFNSSGTYIWDKVVGTNNASRLLASAVDAAGNIFVTGDFFGTTDLGGGTITGYGNGSTAYISFYVAKYDASGNYVWGAPILGNGTYGGDPNGLAIDSHGHAYVVGYMRGQYNFGVTNLTLGGQWLGYDGFLAKYNGSNGVNLWAKSMGGNDGSNTGTDGTDAIAVDGSDNIIVSGHFADTGAFDGTSLSTGGVHDAALTLVSRGATDGFLLKMAAQ